ncbi:hypothetical protein PbJCM13498_18470 [Prolixibacter bellariivorans]|uniref:Uncharacterized protein n=1 Tax=Prolixibacter bellariivorans TaxID=314319 RepID=A0A5M4AYY2_9BACT|nr:hypothetical protein [Prolixibacter bellariivorans]GET32984.1 hypothetical protein PbJCM13498_18470 [Prolixibacter bellariivorans]
MTAYLLDKVSFFIIRKNKNDESAYKQYDLALVVAPQLFTTVKRVSLVCSNAEESGLSNHGKPLSFYTRN